MRGSAFAQTSFGQHIGETLFQFLLSSATEDSLHDRLLIGLRLSRCIKFQRNLWQSTVFPLPFAQLWMERRYHMNAVIAVSKWVKWMLFLTVVTTECWVTLNIFYSHFRLERFLDEGTPEYLDWLSQSASHETRKLAEYARRLDDVSLNVVKQ